MTDFIIILIISIILGTIIDSQTDAKDTYPNGARKDSEYTEYACTMVGVFIIIYFIKFLIFIVPVIF